MSPNKLLRCPQNDYVEQKLRGQKPLPRPQNARQVSFLFSSLQNIAYHECPNFD